jgi:hypothetical protein
VPLPNFRIATAEEVKDWIISRLDNHGGTWKWERLDFSQHEELVAGLHASL